MRFRIIDFLITFVLAVVFAITAVGCAPKQYTRQDQKAYFDDVRITAAIGAAAGYAALKNCAETANMQPCAKTSVLKKLAPAARSLSDAIDKYRDALAASGGGGTPQNNLAFYLAQVNSALVVLDSLIADEGINAVLSMKVR